MSDNETDDKVDDEIKNSDMGKIFEKYTEETNRFALSREEVAKSIPRDATKQPNKELSLTKTEWRWRIFKIPNIKNEFVEISKKIPNEDRLYLNKSEEWTTCIVDKAFDNFVAHSYYYYT